MMSTLNYFMANQIHLFQELLRVRLLGHFIKED